MTVDMKQALSDLRGARRRRHLRGVDKSDLAYRAYVTVVFGLFGFFLALGAVDEAPISDDTIRWLAGHGSQWIGLGIATVVAAALRSGANGGPLTIDDVDAHHLLLSPLSRHAVLDRPVRKLFLGAAGAAGVLGAAAGELAARRMQGTKTEWVFGAALTGVIVGVLAVGCALIVSGHRKRGPIVTAIWMGVTGWSAADVWFNIDTSPLSFLGRIAVWPLVGKPVILVVGMTVAVAIVAVAGHRAVVGVSVERILRRAVLVRQIRFALSQQDLRSLILLRRQLAFEAPRRRPIVKFRLRRLGSRFPVFVRDLRSYMRWPTRRITRVTGLSIAAGLTVAGLWHGTTVMVGAAGVLMYLISLEVVEPYGQEVDHPTVMETMPLETGRILVEHLIGAAFAMIPIWLVVTGAAFAASRSVELLVAMLGSLIPAALVAVGAGALSIQRVGSNETSMAVPPELAGPQVLFKLVWPPALATLGIVPVLVGRQAMRAGNPVASPTINAGIFVVVLGGLVFGWVRFRDSFFEAAAAGQQGKNK